MHWVEEQDDELVPTPDSVVDLVFAIRCRTLAVDHAWDLFSTVSQHLPWLASDPIAGIHPLHVAETAHGWVRPQGPEELLYLSRRTKLVLRLPADRVDDALVLQGCSLRVGQHAMLVCQGAALPLSRSRSLFARRVVIGGDEAEADFVDRMVSEMYAMGVRPKRVLPGLAHPLDTPEGTLTTRLLSIEGLHLDDSFRLQERGLGSGRHLGCGIFIPHKPLSAVRL